MKKIALITKNRILAQSFDAAIKTMGGLEFELFLLLNSHQVLLYAEIFQIDIALIDMAFSEAMNNEAEDKETQLSLCEEFHKRLPNCDLLLLVSQDDKASRIMATQAKKKKVIDDFVFYDASLQYLFAKLSAL